MIGQVVLSILITIHLLGWLAISFILYMFTQYGLSLGEFILMFFLWEIIILQEVMEKPYAKIKEILSNSGNR